MSTLFLERSGIIFPGEGGSIRPTYTQGSFSALEPPKGEKSCFHLSLDHFQQILASDEPLVIGRYVYVL